MSVVALTFSEAGGSTVVLAGPAASDPAEPYIWNPGPEWGAWVDGLGGAAVALTLDDGHVGVAPMVFGVPALSAAVEAAPLPSYAGILAADGDRVLSGVGAAAQRLADALRIQRGSYPLLRDYGSSLHRVVDRRPAAVFAAVAETMAHSANGLDDVELRAVRAEGGEGVVVVEVDAVWRSSPSAAPTPISVREELAL